MAKNKKVEISLEEKLKKALIPVEEQPYKIPDNWVWTKYDVLFSDISKSEKKIEEKNYLENGKIAIVSQGKDKIVGYSDILKIEPYKEELPLIIFGDHTLNVKYIDFPFYIGADGVKVLKTTSIIISKFLFYLLNNLKTFTLINTGYRRHYPILKKLFFPLPPINEQRSKVKKAKELIEEIKIDIENRKISILDRAFKGVLTSKWRNENKTSDVRELLKSINDEKIKKWEEDCIQAEKDGNKKTKKPNIKEVEDMIVLVEEQPYKLPDSWVWVRLGDIIRHTDNLDINKYYSNEQIINYVDIDSINNEFNYIEKFKKAKVKDLSSRARRILKKDFILYSSVRPYLNNFAIMKDELEDCIGSTGFFVFKPINISTLYIFRIFLVPYIKELYLTSIKGFNSPSINVEIFNNTPIPLPPLEEQEEIVRILDEVLENENKVKELLELEERIDILEKAILHKAFKGELGTQNSNDEPAIKLLKEIL